MDLLNMDIYIIYTWISDFQTLSWSGVFRQYDIEMRILI